MSGLYYVLWKRKNFWGFKVRHWSGPHTSRKSAEKDVQAIAQNLYAFEIEVVNGHSSGMMIAEPTT
ncbi:MAG: hypothetical protein HC883_01040 [Bdellovibrionaceae bacterium]|nr:hypothetical protein [Pseudobdellovibrionaceae bacterium]